MNRPGRIALHGGGEFRPGDEPFLRLILEAAASVARTRIAARSALPHRSQGQQADPAAVRVVLLPTAASSERPEMAVGFGTEALRRVAAEAGIPVGIEAAMVVDAASAAAAREVDRLAGADLVYLPGGDPGRLAAILPGSPAGAAVLGAHASGSVKSHTTWRVVGPGLVHWTPAGSRTIQAFHDPDRFSLDG